ncbi:MAG: DUF86 domain-containing protein [Planctomycetota bacterium]
MRLESKKHLEDVRQAIDKIRAFVGQHDFDAYCESDLLRSAVERQFEIIGEALNRLKKTESAVLDLIDDFQRIISFRNILIHGYDLVDDPIVWDVIQSDLPRLEKQVEELLTRD